ncbi:MAG TPA: rRNA maturation RNase YbeY [Steroidobacteraceae bacterium]
MSAALDRRRTAHAVLHVDLQRPVRAWSPRVADITAWASAALGQRARGAELAVRIVGARESRRLNHAYRGRDSATNVLSFPVTQALARAERAAAAQGGPAAREPLGDLVVCAALVREEARVQAKPLRVHWAHLIVHGALHLIGFDHRTPADARRMERREIGVLRRFGFPNPYRSA